MSYSVVIQFQDHNQPRVHVDGIETAEGAKAALRRLFKQYAALSSGWIEENGIRHVYQPTGEHLFSVPVIGGI